MSSILPLDGITVISLEHAIAAPLATRHLADLGARVIKIERPNVGDFARSYDRRANGLASHFVWVNRSKESLTLDLKRGEAREVLYSLLQQADVLVQNLAPGAAMRLGLDYETLAPKFQKLIVCDISGYGDDGPYTRKKAYDLLIQSESGFLSITGTPDEMTKSGISIADISAGMYAYSSILGALLQRARTGKGRRIEIAMIDAMAEWMGFPMYYALDGQEAPPRSGAAHATIYPYGPFVAGDGRTIMLGLQNEREWKVFCEKVLERPELASDARYADNAARTCRRDELRRLIEQQFSSWTADEVVMRLNAADIANAHVNTVADLWKHPQLTARGRWADVEVPGGMLPALLPPGSDANNLPRMGPIPGLGEHTDSILSEFGFDPDWMRAAGIV
ncbi:MAG TPA: CaiB/BaiF CoA-transferase family protein [Noviherbaspirillum sp.]|uniref:CaiB/BaiF CoA transferase family protein n=1 Tax=Noviherbaspirillum sp. TaxID=1926288 RepID=UPI002B491FB9|nr:CaiB/BaiF CoA-transferase family protein [Noviherbaspirillum sp.]HJV88161.1 CaiB/BaiF CoA-transferase family protein [Noviherbaspirillum sp.]